jgi:hypothetical protein
LTDKAFIAWIVLIIFIFIFVMETNLLRVRSSWQGSLGFAVSLASVAVLLFKVRPGVKARAPFVVLPTVVHATQTSQEEVAPSTAEVSGARDEDPSTAEVSGTRDEDPGTADVSGARDEDPGTAEVSGARDEHPGTAEVSGTRDEDPGTAEVSGARDEDPGTAEVSNQGPDLESVTGSGTAGVPGTREEVHGSVTGSGTAEVLGTREENPDTVVLDNLSPTPSVAPQRPSRPMNLLRFLRCSISKICQNDKVWGVDTTTGYMVQTLVVVIVAIEYKGCKGFRLPGIEKDVNMIMNSFQNVENKTFFLLTDHPALRKKYETVFKNEINRSRVLRATWANYNFTLDKIAKIMLDYKLIVHFSAHGLQCGGIMFVSGDANPKPHTVTETEMRELHTKFVAKRQAIWTESLHWVLVFDTCYALRQFPLEHNFTISKFVDGKDTNVSIKREVDDMNSLLINPVSGGATVVCLYACDKDHVTCDVRSLISNNYGGEFTSLVYKTFDQSFGATPQNIVQLICGFSFTSDKLVCLLADFALLIDKGLVDKRNSQIDSLDPQMFGQKRLKPINFGTNMALDNTVGLASTIKFYEEVVRDRWNRMRWKN